MNALSPNIGMDIAEEALTRHLQWAIDRVDASRQHHEREARRHRGVSIAGMAPEPFVEPAQRDLIAAARASAEREAAAEISPTFRAKVKAGELRRFAAHIYQQIEGIEAAMSRGDGSALEKISGVIVALADAGNLATAVYSLEAEAAG